MQELFSLGGSCKCFPLRLFQVQPTMKQRTPPIEPDDGGMASPVFAQEEKKRRTGGPGSVEHLFRRVKICEDAPHMILFAHLQARKVFVRFFLNVGSREIVEGMQRASEKAETVSAEKKNMSFASSHKNNSSLGCGFNLLCLPQTLWKCSQFDLRIFFRWVVKNHQLAMILLPASSVSQVKRIYGPPERKGSTSSPKNTFDMTLTISALMFFSILFNNKKTSPTKH